MLEILLTDKCVSNNACCYSNHVQPDAIHVSIISNKSNHHVVRSPRILCNLSPALCIYDTQFYVLSIIYQKQAFGKKMKYLTLRVCKRCNYIHAHTVACKSRAESRANSVLWLAKKQRYQWYVTCGVLKVWTSPPWLVRSLCLLLPSLCVHTHLHLSSQHSLSSLILSPMAQLLTFIARQTSREAMFLTISTRIVQDLYTRVSNVYNLY